MGRTRQAGLPARVEQLRERIEQWRCTRERRSPMPEELWAEATDLARAGTVYQIARAVGVSYESLKRRVAEAAPDEEAGASSGFVELSGARLLGAAATCLPDAPVGGPVGPGGPVVELSDGDGLRLTIRLVAGETVDVAGLVRGFGARGA